MPWVANQMPWDKAISLSKFDPPSLSKNDPLLGKEEWAGVSFSK